MTTPSSPATYFHVLQVIQHVRRDVIPQFSLYRVCDVILPPHINALPASDVIVCGRRGLRVSCLPRAKPSANRLLRGYHYHGIKSVKQLKGQIVRHPVA